MTPVDPRWAEAGIGVQMLALMRILAEYFRLKPRVSGRSGRELLDHHVLGALVAAVLASVSIGLYFFGRPGGAAAVSALTVAVLLVYKFRIMP